FGADLILPPGGEGLKEAIAKATESAVDLGYFLRLHSNFPDIPMVHEHKTGKVFVDVYAIAG
ncbi:cysteine synthase A, partial [Enterococcus faecalis]